MYIKFSANALEELSVAVENRLSEKRYAHTVGVASAAEKIGMYCLPEALSELSAAALLHDISKEIEDAAQMEILRLIGGLSNSDLMSSAAHHAFTAPYVIKRDFPGFATENILSAVFNHTTGSPDMPLFDEIIFISDYVEEGRKYKSCIEVREELYSALSEAKDREECIMALHKATVRALDRTIISIIESGRILNERTVHTRNAFLSRIYVR